MAVLVTGGAGYVGSHTVAYLLEQNEEVVVVDRKPVPAIPGLKDSKVYVGDLNDAAWLESVFAENDIESVIHLAASSLVGESMVQPLVYYENNVVGTLRLLEVMEKHQVPALIFSSTAAVYGNRDQDLLRESDPSAPASAYGETKLAIERMLGWAEQAHGIKYVALRYFNVAGAHESGEIGEEHDPETHLIALAVQAALGQRNSFTMYGDDYPTRDGSCIRDYIHVMDIAEAHYRALESLRSGGPSRVYNVGTGTGYTVKEVLNAISTLAGKPLPVTVGSRRAGDPPVLVASPERMLQELGWKPTRSGLMELVQSAWKWHSRQTPGRERAAR